MPRISEKPENIKVDAIVTSPPYERTIGKQGGRQSGHPTEKDIDMGFAEIVSNKGRVGAKYSDNEKNIGNLPYDKKVDAIITSPPFKTANQGGGLNKNPPKTFRGVLKNHSFKISENPENIDNLEYGKVDAIVTSPPFVPDPKNQRNKPLQEYDKERGYNPDQSFRGCYGVLDELDEENVSKLREYGEVDVIVTSPPYAEAKPFVDKEIMEKIAKDPSSKRYGRKAFSGYGEKYSEENLANLPYGCTSQDAEYIPDEEEEWEFPNVTTKEQRRWYVSESISHPAKCNVLLVRKIIKEFTKPGDVVLDPMCGCGTTNVEAILLGRNTIAVDLEKKFTDLTEANVQKVEETNAKSRFPLRLGEAKVITGDSRRLNELLEGPRGPDVIVTSPPFHDAKDGKGIASDPSKRWGIGGWQLRGIKELSKDPENIDNIKNYGEVDAIVTSPPYGDISVISYDNVEWTKFFQKQLEEKGYIEWQGKRYTEVEWRAINHGRIDGRTAPGMKKGKVGYSSVDAIVTSPPYSEALSQDAGGGSKKNVKGTGIVQDIIGDKKLNPIPYSESKENIGNLRHGEISAIITSPPFSGCDTAFHDQRDEWVKRKTRALEVCSKEPENIASLKGETYLEAMLKCYHEMFKVLKPSGVLVLVLKNFIRDHKVVDLVGDTIKLCESIGFRLVRRIKHKLRTQSFWRVNYAKQWEKKFGESFPYGHFASVYDFETVLVFQKT